MTREQPNVAGLKEDILHNKISSKSQTFCVKSKVALENVHLFVPEHLNLWNRIVDQKTVDTSSSFPLFCFCLGLKRHLNLFMWL